MVIWRHWIIFPDCSSCLDCCCPGDDWHDTLNPKIEDVCKAGKSIGVGIKCVDTASAQSVLNVVAGRVVVAGIVGGLQGSQRQAISSTRQRVYAHPRWVPANNSSMLTDTDKIPSKICASVLSRYPLECDDLWAQLPGHQWRIGLDPMGHDTHKWCLCLVNRPEVSCCWDMATSVGLQNGKPHRNRIMNTNIPEDGCWAVQKTRWMSCWWSLRCHG